jgi:hypothetical protein
VAFEMTFDFNTSSGVFTGSGGSLIPIVTADPASPFNAFSNPSINDVGTVAFAARLDDSGARIMTGGGGPLTTIADTHDGLFEDFGAFPAINNRGMVIFQGDLATGGSAIMVSRGGPLTTIVDTKGPFSSFGEGPDINDHGTVAFLAELDAGSSGIFTGSDSLANKVVATGDPLFGSIVTELFFLRGGLNNAGQIAFLVSLADERRVIVRATPIPEPSPSLLLATSLLGLVGYHWRRRREGI